MAHVKIETIKDGPYIVSGEVELIDADGNKFSAEKRFDREAVLRRHTLKNRLQSRREKAVPESKE